MSRWLQLSLAVFVIVLTAAVGKFAFAQAAQQPPLIITGGDVGFRVDRQRTQDLGRLAGVWVVRFNGEWVEPEGVLRSRPLSTR